MARQTERLSAKAVEKAKRPGYYCDGAGLYLQVSPALTRSWIFRYTLSGRSREMGLGPYPTISLASARTRASEQRALVVDGVDPIATREALRAQGRLEAANSLSFAECAKKYIAAHRSSWKNAKHAEQWENTLETYAFPIIGKRPVKDVDNGLVLRVLEPIWEKKPETASRLRGRIERILTWATVRGYRAGENPARWRGHLKEQLPSPSKLIRARLQHHAALPHAKLGAFIKELRAEEGTAARALEFCILTATRTAEVIGAKLEEFDLDEGLWIIPAGRMKGGKEHRVPLSPRAIEIVKTQPAGPYLFAGRDEGKPLSNMAMLELLKRMGREDLTVHGFRSTFRDWAAECTKYPAFICEMALAHAVSNKVIAAYLRSTVEEKRRRLMLDWAKYCDTPKASGSVLTMTRRSA